MLVLCYQLWLLQCGRRLSYKRLLVLRVFFSGFSTVGVLHQVKLMAIQLSPDRLLLLFSATWPDEANRLVDEAWLPHEPGGQTLSN